MKICSHIFKTENVGRKKFRCRNPFKPLHSTFLISSHSTYFLVKNILILNLPMPKKEFQMTIFEFFYSD